MGFEGLIKVRSYTVRREQIQRATTSQWALDTRRGLLLGRTEGPCQTHSLTENVKAFMTEDVLEASFFASCTPRRPSDQSAIYGAIRIICYSRGDRGSPTSVRHRILLRSRHVPSSCSPTRLLFCASFHTSPLAMAQCRTISSGNSVWSSREGNVAIWKSPPLAMCQVRWQCTGRVLVG